MSDDAAAMARFEQLTAEMIRNALDMIRAQSLALGDPEMYDDNEEVIQASVRAGVIAACTLLSERGLLHEDEL